GGGKPPHGPGAADRLPRAPGGEGALSVLGQQPVRRPRAQELLGRQPVRAGRLPPAARCGPWPPAWAVPGVFNARGPASGVLRPAAAGALLQWGAHGGAARAVGAGGPGRLGQPGPGGVRAGPLPVRAGEIWKATGQNPSS
ncbi:unnamed protein product, partial [Heterosigma akashiwo]